MTLMRFTITIVPLFIVFNAIFSADEFDNKNDKKAIEISDFRTSPLSVSAIPRSISSLDRREYFDDATIPPDVIVNEKSIIRPIYDAKILYKTMEDGDIFIEINPINYRMDYSDLGLWNMGHAGILVHAYNQVCPLETPYRHSCSELLQGSFHILRVAHSSRQGKEKSLKFAKQWYIDHRHGVHQFDQDIDLDLDSIPLDEIEKRVYRKRRTDFYCSEFVYASHSIGLGRKLFKPTNVAEIFDQGFRLFEEKKAFFEAKDHFDIMVDQWKRASIGLRNGNLLEARTQLLYSLPGLPIFKQYARNIRAIAPTQFFQEAIKPGKKDIYYVGTFLASELEEAPAATTQEETCGKIQNCLREDSH